MREAFLNHAINFITNNQKEFSDEDKEKLVYGLEGLYMNITKLAIILLLSIILGVFKEFIISLVLFNFLRFFGFGFHATKSIHCLVSSAILILGLPYLFINVKISIIFKLFLCITSIISFILFAPADTKKRPLTNKRKRIIRKIFACLLAFIYSGAVILLDGNILSNLFLAAVLTESILISPVMYKLFGESYNNYKLV